MPEENPSGANPPRIIHQHYVQWCQYSHFNILGFLLCFFYQLVNKYVKSIHLANEFHIIRPVFQSGFLRLKEATENCEYYYPVTETVYPICFFEILSLSVIPYSSMVILVRLIITKFQREKKGVGLQRPMPSYWV